MKKTKTLGLTLLTSLLAAAQNAHGGAFERKVVEALGQQKTRTAETLEAQRAVEADVADLDARTVDLEDAADALTVRVNRLTSYAGRLPNIIAADRAAIEARLSGTLAAALSDQRDEVESRLGAVSDTVEMLQERLAKNERLSAELDRLLTEEPRIPATKGPGTPPRKRKKRVSLLRTPEDLREPLMLIDAEEPVQSCLAEQSQNDRE